MSTNHQEIMLDYMKKDDKYLLRLSQDAKWESIKQCCSVLDSILCCSIFIENEELISVASKQLLSRDNWGNTPLLVVCHHRPPLYVVQAILKTSSLAGQHNVLQMVNESNHSPIVIACITVLGYLFPLKA